MRWVECAAIRPQRCAVIPFIGASHEKGFIDTGSELQGFDNHVYVSVVAVEEMARFIGWAPPHDTAGKDREIAEKDRRIADLEAQLAEADNELNAVHVLKGKGWTPARKPGRPPKQKETV